MISLSYLTVNGARPLEHIEAAAAGGFDAADIRILAPTHIPIRQRVIGNDPLISELKRLKQRHGVSIASVESVTLKPGTKIGSLEPALETAAELGARNILTIIENLQASEAGDQFAALCEMGKSYGLRMALEFMAFRSVNTLDVAAKIVADYGGGNAGVLIDAMHLFWTGGTAQQVAALAPDQIAYVQLCDAQLHAPPVKDQVNFARSGRLYLGKGELPLSDLLDALPPQTPLSVEIPYRAHARRSVIERAMLVGTATRHFLAEYRQRRQVDAAEAS